MNQSNFRPLSVLTCISKAFESLMNTQIEQGVSCLLSHVLSAYRKGYSSEYVLLKAIEDWRAVLDNDESVGCVFMDLSKAFDFIPHRLLLTKLNAYGFTSNACEFIRSYFTERKQ